MADTLTATRPAAGAVGGRRVDPLGLRRALGDRLLPVMVATMAFLAGLALGGALAAQDWADGWRLGAGTALTAQIPDPADAAPPDAAPADATPAGADPGPATGAAAPSRLDRALAILRASPVIATARLLPADQVAALLRPWLGADAGAAAAFLPAVVAARAAADATDEAGFDRLARTLARAVPGASLERHAVWAGRLTRLARGLEGCAWGAVLVVAAAATLVIGAATRAGLVARRGTVDILHGLGATDSYVARRFARRAMGLAGLGGGLGALAALPVLLAIDGLARPFATQAGAADGVTAAVTAGASPGVALPPQLWGGLVLIPIVAAAIGYLTAHGTVTLWLRRLP
jgi:cell division transport system permease protein